MDTEAEGTKNILLVSLFISCVLHFALMQTESVPVGLNEESLLSATTEEMRIPVAFIPSAQNLTVRQYSASELASLQKLLEDSAKTEAASKSQAKSNGLSSLNRTRAAIKHYLLSIREEIEKNKKTSASPKYSTLVGNVEIGFLITADGLFTNLCIQESSGDHLLDRSAIEAINKTSGKIKRPKNTGFQTIQTSAVIKYQYGL